MAAALPPPATSEPLLTLLRRAHARKPGVWLPHEQLMEAGVATAPLVRRLAAAGTIERQWAALSSKGRSRTLVRLPFAEDVVDLRDVERRANAVLAVVGHAVTVLPGRGAANEFTTVKITYRGFTYTGYRHSRPWTVHAAPIA